MHSCHLPAHSTHPPLCPPPSLPHPQDWIPDAVWLNVMVLAQLDTFRDLPDSIARSDAAWRSWYDQEAPEAAPIPDLETRLTKFQRMCVVRCAGRKGRAGGEGRV